MIFTVKAIEWSPMPRVPHGRVGMVKCRNGLRKVAGIINENENPRRPKTALLLPKPYTLELYIPLMGGQDRILKFAHEGQAEEEAAKALLRLCTDLLENAA